MPTLVTGVEKKELITGIKNAFSDVQFIGRFLDVFIQSIKMKASSPGKTLFERIINDISRFEEDEKLSRILNFLRDERNQSRIITGWERELQHNKLRGQTISNIAAVCVEAYLQNGTYFVKGERSNDLRRIADNSRWEIKGSRDRQFKLTINQSAVGIDETFFILYCGFPEENQLHGIYCIQGRDSAFSERRPNMNMRTFLPECYDDLVQQIYP